MTDDIRDRLAEWIETHRSYDPESFGTIVESLAALVGEMLLAERAAALGAAGDVVRQTIDECQEEDYVAWDTLESVLIERIRSISPEGWRGVREADLAVLKEAARDALHIPDDIDWHFPVPGIHLSPEDGWACAALNASIRSRRKISTLRAALARMP